MTINCGTIQNYKSGGYGFISRTFSPSKKAVYFHITKIKRNYPEIAERLDNNDLLSETILWYEVETTNKGEQVVQFWLDVNDIPVEYSDELQSLVHCIEIIWTNVEASQPNWLNFVTIQLVGVDRKNELCRLRESMEHECRLAQEKLQKEIEIQRRLAQEKLLKEIELQEAEQRIKQNSKRQARERIIVSENLTEQEKLEVRKYVDIFLQQGFKEHWQVNTYITHHNCWNEFSNMRSINDHVKVTGILGIKPRFFAIVCKVLEIEQSGGSELIGSKGY